MSYAAIRIAVEQRMVDNWLTTPLLFSNDTESTPSGTNWVRITVLSGDDVTQELTSTPARTITAGVMVLQIFTPVENGLLEADQLCDLFVDLMANKSFSGITTDGASRSDVGQTNIWQQINLSITFEYEE